MITTLFRFLIPAIMILNLMPEAGLKAAQAGAVRHVTPGGVETGECTGWSAACTLPYALSIAQAGDEVWVAEGTYTPGPQREDSFTIPGGVAVYGGFQGDEAVRADSDWQAHPTILTGEIGDPGTRDDNSYHVVTINAPGQSVTFSGFTVRDGRTAGQAPSQAYGGGIAIPAGSATIEDVLVTENDASAGGGLAFAFAAAPGSKENLTLRRAAFTHNQADAMGGGVAAFTNGGLNTFEDVAFEENQALGTANTGYGGGLYANGNATKIARGRFYKNSAKNSGGGACIDAANASLEDTVFTQNTAGEDGGGAGFINSTVSDLRRVQFFNNTATNGGGIYTFNRNSNQRFQVDRAIFSENAAGMAGGGIASRNAASRITNTVFWKNQARGGGGLYTNNGSQITNVTFSMNNATDAGGAIWDDWIMADVQNSILWGDTAPVGAEYWNNSMSSYVPSVFYYTILKGMSDPAFHVYATDPKFTNAARGILRLSPTSPAIDKGYNVLVPFWITQDLNGWTRIVDYHGTGSPAVDLGAYEAVPFNSWTYLPLIGQ